MEGCLERYSGKPIREWDEWWVPFVVPNVPVEKCLWIPINGKMNAIHCVWMFLFSSFVMFSPSSFVFCMFFIYLFYFLNVFFLDFLFRCLCGVFFSSCLHFCKSLMMLLKSHWFEETWLISRLPVLIKTKPMLCFCFHRLQKSAFFFALCDASFVFDFAIYFPDSFLFLKGRMLLRCCFLFPCYVCRFPPKAVHTMDAVPFLCLHFICCLFFTGSLNRRKMWNLVKTLFFCRFYPIGLFSFPSLCIESFADGFLPMRISSFLFYFCILCTRHMMAYNSWIWTSTWWANFSSWLVSFLNICASVVSFNLHFFCICAVHHWFCTLPVRLSVCVCVRVSVCALAFVHHL